MFFSPYCSPRQHLGILEIWLACVTLWQCVWRKIQSSNFQCSLKTCTVRSWSLPSPALWHWAMGDWPLDRGGASTHAPTLGWSPLVPTIYLWSCCFFPQNTLSSLGSSASLPPGIQEYSWLFSIEGGELGALSKLIHFLLSATTSVPPLPSLTASNTRQRLQCSQKLRASPDSSQESSPLNLMSSEVH